ncbi:MAG: NlpC/P60 family protein [Actinomycetota bacterium]|nr:NlpC/P60 family protein [Actinomycetota bacterium]MDQ3577898.1 NlpC/P60 family protein [Actinomycetota bacterium]
MWNVPFVITRIPGMVSDLREGANCQRFAYAVLAHFGLHVAPTRSSELWADTATIRVSHPEPLDLLLFNKTADAWGAHVGVWIGDDQVLHLCSEVGKPAVWRMADFASRARYRELVGIKRVLAR